MAHKVTFDLPTRQLGRADITFQVANNGSAVGKLLVSKGSIVWRGPNKRRGKKLTWKRLDELMQEHGASE